MIPKRSIELIDRFKAQSERLGADVEAILTMACKPDSERDCAGHDVTQERLKDLYVYIELSHESKLFINFHEFIIQGFDKLRNELFWANIEQELFIFEIEQVHTKRGGSILSALMHLTKIFFNDQKLWPPSRVFIASVDKTIDISQMFLYPSMWVVDFKKILEKILLNHNGYSKYHVGISLMLKAFSEARNEPIIARHVLNKTISNAIDDDDFYEILLSKIPKHNQSRLKKIRRAHNPERHGTEAKFAGKSKYTLNVGNESKGAHWIHELSPKWFVQCVSYITDVFEKNGKKAAVSSITRLTKISSAIFDHKNKIKNLEHLKEEGISAFFDHDKSLIKTIYVVEDQRIRDCIGEIFFMHNHLFDSNHKLTDLIDLAVIIDCDSGDDNYRSIILDPLVTKYPALAKSIYDYAQYELKRIDGNKKSKETVFAKISMIKAIFTSHLDLLNSNDHLLLAELGLAALEENSCNIIKRIRYAIADKFKNGKLSLGSARGIQSAFRLFCSHYKITDVRSYSVSGKSRKTNESRKKITDYYDKEEVATIAYAIELGLMNAHLSEKEELLLRLGRILIKTGWNLAPLLMLNIDDILKLDAPITGKTAHFVRLFKKRADYKTQFYEFEMSSNSIKKEGIVFGIEVTNALTDLEYIRDKISSKLRDKLPKNSKLKYRLSLYRNNNDKILGFTHIKFSAWLNEVLRRFECKIPFSVQRIRKGGLNYIYKTYAKNFKKYEKAGQHSLETFLEVYLRNDSIKSEETIASATKIMSDYFSGRPISDDIIIVTEIPVDTKKTPSGLCASHGNDAEYRAFAKQQQRLNRSSDTVNSQCGDFNACLFCRHFRLVADAEHIWRLLSYQRYVVGDMERGLSDYSNTSDQAAFIEVLNKRVETMLNDLREININAVENGIALLKKSGCHDDWAFYVNIGDSD
ncbi:hypothetical protein G3485_09000 [Shewanella baltica]|uniref:hypothetical protein n=2 Tax=Shewanella baltica TaxID=62322 RepID=UPI00217D4AB5|nr:hypothetical protein [Shewanella baltica]MCS6127137.1 hypothetical protein [Shewanella baltica]MCS6139063.1 hypothetical protein [Shewanella baltica]MCS6145203.1 hypothetical protein [Shewanella baltica]MCS6169733.1 hypothetical protein [Shewanella baltica]MCS6186957.1 hypothetical protein [Shewanella baltica]